MECHLCRNQAYDEGGISLDGECLPCFFERVNKALLRQAEAIVVLQGLIGNKKQCNCNCSSIKKTADSKATDIF